MKKPQKDFSTMEVDDFLNCDFEEEDADSDGDQAPAKSVKKEKKKKTQKAESNGVEKLKKKKKTEAKKEEKVPKKKLSKKKVEIEAEKSDSSEAEDESEIDEKSHKEALNKLKDVDPEFYQYLEQNDKKLLKFGAELDDASDSEEEEEDAEKPDEEDDETPELEVASDESDFEDNEEVGDNVITLKLLKKWQTEMSVDKPEVETLRNVATAFNSAILSISGDDTKKGKFVVEGSAVFNGILQLCILHFQGALKRFLGVDVATKDIQKCKKFKKVSNILRSYLLDISNLLANVTSTNILTVLLKHLHQLTAVLQAFSSITKPILKRLITLWSSEEETIRILAFMCILRITRQQQQTYLANVLKYMYLSYVKNSRFVSPKSHQNINFMRRSLVEMFALDLNTSYQHGFLYIRQLAINLRNAVTLKQKESFQKVYNWQYINSMRLWVDVLAVTHGKPQLQPLIYPLVSIICGVIKLIPTVAYFPLRFHCCKMLADLSRETKTFIPIMPYIMEVLDAPKLNEQHKKLSMRPLKFTSILRVGLQQMEENAFRDEVIENVYGHALQVMAQEACSVAFPDLAVMPMMALKAFIKKSKNANYNRKMKQLVDKIQENINFIEAERKGLNCQLKDFQVIAGWEANVRNKEPPLLKAFEEYAKSTQKKKKREAADTDTINAYDLPTLHKNVGSTKRKAEGPVDLFPDSSGDEEELEILPKPKKQKNEDKKAAKAQKKKITKKNQEKVNENDDDDDVEDIVDIVEDFNIDEW